MLSCKDAERLIARQVDGILSADERPRLDDHVERCAACRASLTAQQEVAALLRARGADVSADIASGVSARLDAEAGVFGMANWRAWTLGLAPVAAALMLAAYLGIGATTTSTQQTAEQVASSTASTSVLMEPGTSGDTLVEAVLTGTAAGTVETGDVR